MSLRTSICRGALAAALAGAGALYGGAGQAVADTADSVMCNFTLSEPTVIDVSGVPMVTASVVPAACTGTAKPTSTQVCLSAAGSSTAGRCAELPGFTDVHVYLSPYQPGVAYTATGRGCAAQSVPPAPICTTVGPTTVTL